MTLDRTNWIGEWRGSNWIPNYPKVEFKHDLESCYITIKGRVFYIDMSGDTPGVTTWTEATCSIRNDDPTDEIELVPAITLKSDAFVEHTWRAWLEE